MHVELTAIDMLRNLRMQVNRLENNRLRITGWTGNEELLDDIIKSLREQADWLERMI